MGGTSRDRKDIWGTDVTEHFDASGNKTGESRRQAGLFGDFTAHYDSSGSKTGESRQQAGLFADYTAHYDSSGSKTGESRRQAGLFGDYTAHYDSSGSKTGETRDRSGLFGDYQAHEGRWQPIGGLEPGHPSAFSGGIASDVGYSGYSGYSGGAGRIHEPGPIDSFVALLTYGMGGSAVFLVLAVIYSVASIWLPIPDGNVVGPWILIVGGGLGWAVGLGAAVWSAVTSAKPSSAAGGVVTMVVGLAASAVAGLVPAAIVAVAVVGGRFYERRQFNPTMQYPFIVTLESTVVLTAVLLSLGLISGVAKGALKYRGTAAPRAAGRRLAAGLLATAAGVSLGAALNGVLALLWPGALLLMALAVSPAPAAKRVLWGMVAMAALAVHPASGRLDWLPAQAEGLLMDLRDLLLGNNLVLAASIGVLVAMLLGAILTGVDAPRSAGALMGVAGVLPPVLILLKTLNIDSDLFLRWSLPLLLASSALIGVWSSRRHARGSVEPAADQG